MENPNQSLENSVEKSYQQESSKFDRTVTGRAGCAGFLLASPLAFFSGGFVGQEILERASIICQKLQGISNIYPEENLMNFALGGLAGMALYGWIAGDIMQNASERIQGIRKLNHSHDNKRDFIKSLHLDKLPVPYIRFYCRKYLENHPTEQKSSKGSK